MTNRNIEHFKRIGTGIAFVLVPIILIFGFASHSNLADLEPPGNVETWVGEFHGNVQWRIAHIAVMWATLPITVIFLHWMRALQDKMPVWSFLAGLLGIVGCFMLAADKGALGLVPTAFDTLPEEQFRRLLPGLQAMIQYKGQMWMARLYALIPVSFILMGIALIRTKIVPRWQGAAIVLGALMLLNPDIDLISLIASVVLAIGLVPMGFALIRNPQQ
jgi:hypothetical protein